MCCGVCIIIIMIITWSLLTAPSAYVLSYPTIGESAKHSNGFISLNSPNSPTGWRLWAADP